jgi:hypothetical protein
MTLELPDGGDLIVACMIGGGGIIMAAFTFLTGPASRGYMAGPRTYRRAVRAARRSRPYHGPEADG